MSEKNTKTTADDLEKADDACIDGDKTEGNIDCEINDLIEQFKLLSNDELIETAVGHYQAHFESQTKVLELSSLCKRVQADFDNFRKRNTDNIARVRRDAASDVIEKFLPTIDIVDQALLMIKDEQTLGGIKMMRKQLMDVFEAYGVCEINPFDEVFDPSLHEAVMSEKNDAKAGKVLEVLRKGYKMGDKILRYAAVKVAN